MSRWTVEVQDTGPRSIDCPCTELVLAAGGGCVEGVVVEGAPDITAEESTCLRSMAPELEDTLQVAVDVALRELLDECPEDRVADSEDVAGAAIIELFVGAPPSGTTIGQKLHCRDPASQYKS